MRAYVVLCFGLLAGATCRTYDVTYTDDGGTCPTLCDGGCVDLTTDRNNCGQCGVVCTPNELCEAADAGGCTPCPIATNVACGTGGGAFCTDVTTDDNNCGICDNACPHGTHCVASKCSCALTQCGAACVDTQTDVAHCGGCDSPCSSPDPNEVELCTMGQCSEQCVAPFADCDGISSNGCETNLQTNAANCGACGRSCGAGTCASGQCPANTYATGSNLMGLAVDSSFVYWANDTTNGVISKAAIGTSTGQTVYSTSTATLLGVDGTRIVWMQATTAVDSMLLTGGPVTQLASFASGSALTVSAGFAYYATTDGKLWRVPTDGSALPTMMAFSSFAPVAVVVDATNAYFADTTMTIDYVPITANNATPKVFAANKGATSLAIDTANIYWTTNVGTILSQPKAMTTSKTLVSGQTFTATPNIATDGTSIYWSTTDGNVHRAAAVDGTTPIVLATGQGAITTMIVDATNVYWTSPVNVASTAK